MIKLLRSRTCCKLKKYVYIYMYIYIQAQAAKILAELGFKGLFAAEDED
jgi:hypothetical protein